MADYEVVNNVAVITCQNPPVNQLSYKLRVGLFNGLEEALKDKNVKAIVIIGGGRTFPAGADVREFATGEAFKLNISEFINKCDASPKPLVAAIHGTALGGGLEIALACHYRIGTSSCKVGFPEVLIGLLPGAQGTQRLPRVTGSMIAAELICTGQQISADRAEKIKILDKVIHIEPNHPISSEQLILRHAAVRYAIEIADKPFENRVLSRKKVEPLNDFFYDQLRGMMAKRARGILAPELCLQSVKAAADSKTFQEGVKKENELFMKLAQNSQSQALQHIFFAQREISKIPGVDSSLARNIKKVGIIGCGTMGGGILMNFVQVGIPVVILESQQSFLDRGLDIVKGNWTRQVKKGKLPQGKFEEYWKLIKPTLNYADLKDVDIVIEAVFENLKIKKEVFEKLDSVCKKDCVLASNTSFLDITKIAAFTKRPQQVVGTHFFAPANQMLLLENIRHDKNDATTLATIQQMAKVIKKHGVLVRTCEGFVGNRIFAVEGSEAHRLLLEGATPQQIDKVVFDFGFPMGIFQVMDLSGLDVMYRHREDHGWLKNKELSPTGAEYYPFDISDELVSEHNRLGLKVGKGFYDYEGGRKAVASKQVNDLIIKFSEKKGIKRRTITNEEIVERCFYPMVNEGFKILEEGIAIRPSDIDVVLVFGYGFPAYKGGIMFWGDLIGLSKIRDALNRYSQQYPNVPYFKPSSLLNKLADSKTSLAKHWKQQEKKFQIIIPQ